LGQWASQSLLIDVAIIKGKKEKKSKAIENNCRQYVCCIQYICCQTLDWKTAGKSFGSICTVVYERECRKRRSVIASAACPILLLLL
jgi:hypothetical protein